MGALKWLAKMLVYSLILIKADTFQESLLQICSQNLKIQYGGSNMADENFC